jgi:methylmalonyl-CoA/ethylmalonyl-CoA epimerase
VLRHGRSFPLPLEKPKALGKAVSSHRTPKASPFLVVQNNKLLFEREIEARNFAKRQGRINVMKIDHLGIATNGLNEALKFWRDALGLELKDIETVEDQKVRVAMLPVGESRIELLEATSEDSPIAKFLQKRGAGIHHIAVRVDDIRATLSRLKREGARLIDEEPRIGAGGCLVAFVHPTATNGVLLELVQHTEDSKH